VRWTAFYHLLYHDSQAPNVRLGVVGSNGLDYFRGHPVWCACERVPFAGCCSKESGDTEIAYHDFASICDENVGSLHVAVNNGHLVQIAESDEDLSDYDRDVFLFEAAVLRRFHERENASALGEFHDNPDARSIEVAAKVLCYVGSIAELGQEGDLALDVADIVVGGVEVDDLEGDNVAGGDVPSLVYGAIRAFAYSLETLEELVDGHEGQGVM
jgi:hypothetical protein